MNPGSQNLDEGGPANRGTALEKQGSSISDFSPKMMVSENFRVLTALSKPKAAAALIGGMLLMLACNVNQLLGPHALGFKLHYAHWFMLFLIVVTCWKIYESSAAARTSVVGALTQALPWFLVFCALLGVHGLVSNGLDYQRMATDYWDGDPLWSTARRIGLPALAHVLGFERTLYTVFWYALLFGGFSAAMDLLVTRGLSRFEAISVLSSSIFAYALVGPGYNEMFVFLLGLLAMRLNLSLTEKIIVAALMIATHETATPFVALAVILFSDVEDRYEWIAVLGLLYLAFVASYVFTWQSELGQALLRAGKPDATGDDSSWALAKRHPALVLTGTFMAYKLYWLPVLTSLRRGSSMVMGGMALVSIVLAFIGSDTSRLVQFGSLTLFLAVTIELRSWSAPARRLLATTNLVIPSLYIATNAGLLWGPGLYSLYLRGASIAGFRLGRVFWS